MTKVFAVIHEGFTDHWFSDILGLYADKEKAIDKFNERLGDVKEYWELEEGVGRFSKQVRNEHDIEYYDEDTGDGETVKIVEMEVQR
jgi:hypothetical protein